MSSCSNNPQLLEADELLIMSIMSKIPVLIVEGSDDIPVYENIAYNMDIDIEVFASENIPKISNEIKSKLESFSWSLSSKPIIMTKPFLNKNKGKEGCVGVINAINEISRYSGDYEYEKFVMGIIDKDVNDYKNTIPSLSGIFILKYYSLESHYVNKEVIPYIINYASSATMKLVDSQLIDKIFDNIIKSFDDLYYISLESLKNACENSYISDFGYKPDSFHGILNKPNFQEKKQSLYAKKEQLDQFATNKNITFDESNLLKIVKGKWYIEQFIKELGGELKKLKTFCRDSKITQCQYCSTGSYSNCLYKVSSYNESSIKNLIFNYTDLPSFDYIKNKISELEFDD